MRKLTILAVAITAILVTAAVAFAQGQTNTYKVTASTKPAKAGSKKHPKAVKLKFDVGVSEAHGLRPATVKRYKIGFYGLRSNGKAFKTCSANKINAAGDDSVCSKKAKVGSGKVVNAAGNSADPSNTSLKCNLGLTIYNAGKNKLALFLHGSPPQCVVTISQAINAKFVKVKGGTALQFNVPSTLLHPLGGIDNAVERITSTINKKTARKHGKKVGFLESTKCKGSKRPVTVTFTQEHGGSKTAHTKAKC